MTTDWRAELRAQRDAPQRPAVGKCTCGHTRTAHFDLAGRHAGPGACALMICACQLFTPED